MTTFRKSPIIRAFIFRYATTQTSSHFLTEALFCHRASDSVLAAASQRSITRTAIMANTNSSQSNCSYNVRPLNPHFGIEGLDIDLSDPNLLSTNDNDNNNSNKFISQLKKDLIQHRAVLFRKQNLSGQRQVDISNALGIVKSTFYKHPKSPHPDIFRVSNDEAEGCRNVGRSGWHIDGTFQTMPFKYQTMYFPSVMADGRGGDTYFVPLKELYDSFTQEERERYDKLWMVTGRREAPVHPMVYRHPYRPGEEETMLFHCGRPFASGFYCDADADAAEGSNNDTTGGSRVVNGVDTSKMTHPAVVQDHLTNQIESKLDEFGIRMKWEEGDFLIVDNLGLAHYASEGTQENVDAVGLRILHRTTIVGEGYAVPRKLDGRRSFTLS